MSKWAHGGNEEELYERKMLRKAKEYSITVAELDRFIATGVRANKKTEATEHSENRAGRNKGETRRTD